MVSLMVSAPCGVVAFAFVCWLGTIVCVVMQLMWLVLLVLHVLLVLLRCSDVLGYVGYLTTLYFAACI